MSTLTISEMAGLERNIWLLKLHRIDAFIFIGAVFVAFQMHSVGLSLTQILIGESIFSLTAFLFEIPTGIFSDLVSRKKTLFIAELIFFAGVVTFAFAENFTHVIVSQILTGVAIATISGTDSAMLYDTLKALGREHEHKKILGNITSFFLVILAIAQAIGGLLATIDLRLPELIGIPFTFAILILICFLKEPPRAKNPRTKPFDHARETLTVVWKRDVLFVLMMASTLIPLAFKISIQTFNPYMESIHVPIAYWGFLTGSFNLLAAFLVTKAHAVERKLGFLKSYVGMFALTVFGFLLMARAPVFIAFLWPAIPWVLRPFADVFFSDEMNKRTESNRRATVLSISSAFMRFLQIAALPLVGYVSDLWSLETMYLMLAAFLATISLLTWGRLFIQRKKYCLR